MKKKLRYFLFLISLCIPFLGFSGLNVNAAANDIVAPSPTYLSENENIEAFYTSSENGSIEGLKNQELLEKLASLLSEKHRYYTTYGECRGALAFSDEDLNDENAIRLFYAGIPFSNVWGSGYNYNREHVWCKSLSGGLYTSVNNTTRNAGSDIHQIKPSIPAINSSRNNYPYADLNHQGTEIEYQNQKTGNYFANETFEPREDIKGDIARILMYMYTHYSTEVKHSTTGKNGNLSITNIVYTPTQSPQDAWDLLLYWNQIDPVDEFEMNRNQYCASITGVRNPFIDHPEFAIMIWDENYNGNGALLDEDFFTLKETKITLSLNNTYQIETSMEIDSSLFSYTSSDETIATVTSSGKIETKKTGQVNILVSYKNYTQMLSVNIIDEQQQFTIHFYLNDESNQLLDTKIIHYGDNLFKPNSPKRAGYDFLYWSTSKEGNKAYDFSKSITSSFDLYAIWQISALWKKVNNTDELSLNQTYIIVATNYPKALSTSQNTNNRVAVEIEKISDDTLQVNDQVQMIQLSNGIQANTYSFRVQNEYLYAAGGTNNNYLRTQSTLTMQSSFHIEISENGNASIVCADEVTTRNTLRYNAANDLFSCYLSTNSQYDVCLYQLIQPNDISFQMQMQLAFKANWDKENFSNFSQYQIIFESYLSSIDENMSFGCIYILNSNLKQNGYHYFEEVYEDQQENINLAIDKVQAIENSIDLQKIGNQFKLQFKLEDIRQSSEIYSIVFYAREMDSNQYFFSSQIDISLEKIVDIYLENESLLDTFENKEKILFALAQIKEEFAMA